jgi:hypothetical protein
MKPSDFMITSLETMLNPESYNILVDMINDMDLEVLNVVAQ